MRVRIGLVLAVFGVAELALAGTVAHWRLEEGPLDAPASGADSILDSSGNGLHGTPVGGPVYRAVDRVPDSSLGLEFDGATTRIFVPDDPLFELTQSLTIEAYIKLDAYPDGPYGWGQIVFRGDEQGGMDPYALTVTSTGQLLFRIVQAHNVNAQLLSPTPLSLGEVYHVAATLDDATGEQKIFVNGREVASQITDLRPLGALDPNYDAGIGIGNLQSSSYDMYFEGVIDEVRISDVALSRSEFLPPPREVRKTVAHWRFEEGPVDSPASGTDSILDSSGNELHGTPIAGPVYRAVDLVPDSSLGLEFDGATARVFVPDDPKFELTRSLTIEAYIKLDAYPDGPYEWGQIVFRGDERGGMDPYALTVTSTGQVLFRIVQAHNVNVELLSPSPLSLGEVYHVAATLDDATGEQKIFVNGQEVASQITDLRPLGPLDPNYDAGIGIGNLQSSSYDMYFEGVIDEVRITNVALAPSEFLPPPLEVCKTVAHWRFEEGPVDSPASGTDSILDSSGNELHGTPIAGPVYRAVSDVPDSSLGLEFDGATARVFVPDDPKFELTESLTIEAYIKLDAYPDGPYGWGQIVFRGDERGGMDPYALTVTSTGQVLFRIVQAHNVNVQLLSPSPLSLGQIYHVAATLDDATGAQKIFVNGQEVASQTTDLRPLGALDPNYDAGIGIGNLQSSSYDMYFEGVIDEVRISDAALSPSEFLPPPPGGTATLTISYRVPEWGDVLLDPEPEDANLPTYPIGTDVTLTAVPKAGREFWNWTIFDPNFPNDANYATTDSNCVTTITMNGDMHVLATFSCAVNVIPMLSVALLSLGALALIVRTRRR